MDRQYLRKASFSLLFVIVFGLVASAVAAVPVAEESSARHQATHEISWWTQIFQSIWGSISSVMGTAPEPETTNTTPDPAAGGDPNLQGGLDPLG
ncbi:MAG: hypothetical protein HC897_03890 [Thermoanaerobaculia bacterium]|nr:hypothetical protein [Thermoanaerobaculia bacterium]